MIHLLSIRAADVSREVDPGTADQPDLAHRVVTAIADAGRAPEAFAS